MGNTARTGQGANHASGTAPWPDVPVSRGEWARLYSTVDTLAYQLHLILLAAGQNAGGPDDLFTATATAQARRRRMHLAGGTDVR